MPIDFSTGPLVLSLLLVASTAVPFRTLLEGVIGDETIAPYTIILLFFSLAYVCISLDATNLFSWLAVLVVQQAGSSPKRLFVFLFCFSSVLTLFASNDTTILTLTPIICNIANMTGGNAVPLLVAVFSSANIFSIALIIGNPTNVIAAEAFGLGFVEYMQWMTVPACICGAVALLILYRYYETELKEWPMEDLHFDRDRYRLFSRPLTVAKSALFLAWLVLFALSDVIHVKLWILCSAAGAMFLAMDLILDIGPWHGNLEHRSICVASIQRLPLLIAPFMVGMFALVYALETAGWISQLAVGLGAISDGESPGYFVFTTLLVSVLTTAACILMNNQPMTILFSRVFLSSQFTSSLKTRQAALFSLILGSNLGATFAIVASMAGLMFVSILHHYNVTSLSPKTFRRDGFRCMPVVVFTGAAVLVLELAVYAA